MPRSVERTSIQQYHSEQVPTQPQEVPDQSVPPTPSVTELPGQAPAASEKPPAKPKAPQQNHRHPPQRRRHPVVSLRNSPLNPPNGLKRSTRVPGRRRIFNKQHCNPHIQPREDIIPWQEPRKRSWNRLPLQSRKPLGLSLIPSPRPTRKRRLVRWPMPA